MGKMVFAGAMSHVLDPDYYDAACGPVGRRKVEDVMEAIRQMGARLVARSPDALTTRFGPRPIPPLVPIWVNCFVAPQPTARRCFDFGRHIARVVAGSPWNVGIIATGGLSHFPELLVARVGESDTVFDRKILHWL